MLLPLYINIWNQIDQLGEKERIIDGQTYFLNGELKKYDEDDVPAGEKWWWFRHEKTEASDKEQWIIVKDVPQMVEEHQRNPPQDGKIIAVQLVEGGGKGKTQQKFN